MTRPLFLLAGLSVLVACGDDTSAPDAGRDSGRDLCTVDADCDDGLFCNGSETCVRGAPGRDERDCVSGESPCADTDTCDEALSMCVPCTDADGDGACASVDCDDEDPGRFPGNTEVCDALNVDEDCDPTTFGDTDADEDGQVDGACCNDAAGTVPVCGRDCDDTNTLRGFGFTEACDGFDNDCDGAVDEGVSGPLYPDLDGDGFGDRDAEPMLGCYLTSSQRRTRVDCDDTDPRVFPGAGEICGNAVDDNCNGSLDEGCSCTGSETSTGTCPLPGRCGDADELCVDGIFECESTPGPIDETCDGVDDDCDGRTDEGVSIVCYEDDDDDGWPFWGADVAVACSDASRSSVGGCPEGLTDRVPEGRMDCDDADPAISPDAEEVCGNLDDEDCDLRIEEGCE